MSNEPSLPTQFQQKAELRLQEMELEWRRTLFERFRTICREEMMDVMQALMSNTKATSSGELEAKMEEIRQSTEMHHSELLASVTEIKQNTKADLAGISTASAQTAEELHNLKTKLEQPQTADPQIIETISKGQQAMSEALASKQEETSNLLQEDVRKTAQLSQTATKKAVMITALVCVLLGAGAVAALYFLGGATLVRNTDLKSREQAITQKNALTAEVKTLQGQKDTLQKEIDQLKAQKQATETEARQVMASQATLVTNVNTLQQSISRLQELQEQFRFKLVKGEAGGVFVEIPQEAQPFQYQDRTFIQVK